MPSDTTPMRQRLADGQVVLGLNARLSRTSEIGAILAACGYSWFFVDNEHSPIPTGTAYEMCLGAIRAGITPFARARTNEASEITSWLNT